MSWRWRSVPSDRCTVVVEIDCDAVCSSRAAVARLRAMAASAFPWCPISRRISAIAALVGGASGTACSAFHPAGQVAALDLTEHAARGLQALDDLHERRYERDAGEHQHQALLDVE